MRVHEEWMLTPWRLALHEPTRTAVIADLHLGYNLARRQSGEAVPLVDLQETLTPIYFAYRAHRFHRLVIAGDLFEKEFCPLLWRDFRDRLTQLGIEDIGIVPGNHDRGLRDEESLSIQVDGIALGEWTVLHGNRKTKAKKVIMGHWHPCVPHDGAKTPCFVVGSRRIVLPAFSDDAAGVNIWRHPQWRGQKCIVIANGQLVDAGFIPGGAAPSKGRKASKKSSRPWEGRLQRG